MSEFQFAGQWRGPTKGDPAGELTLDLDQTSEGWQGSVYLWPELGNLPRSYALLSIPKGVSEYNGKVPAGHFDPGNGREFTTADLINMFSEHKFPEYVEFSVQIRAENSLKIEWKTSVGSHGISDINRISLGDVSRVPARETVKSWADFKADITNKKFGDFIFRGQRKPWPLQSSFHRSDRKDLHRYLSNDIPRLHRTLSGRTKHYFDLDKPVQLGAFMNLVQHHGYPTPLLDWTYSPFVAAWFAYSELLDGKENSDCVRIFFIDRRVISGFRMFQTLTLAPPHFSLLDTLTIENSRAIPQQGILALTNLADIEGHLISLQENNKCEIISAYDLPVEEAEVALNDLAMMGITRSTLFPGLDSICRDLRDSAFPRMS